MDITTLGTVVGIVAICYVIGLGCKAYEKIPDKWIPVIMAVCGGALGIAGLYCRGYPPLASAERLVRCWLSFSGKKRWLYLQTPTRKRSRFPCKG